MRKPVKDDISGDAIGIEGWGGLTYRPIIIETENGFIDGNPGFIKGARD